MHQSELESIHTQHLARTQTVSGFEKKTRKEEHREVEKGGEIKEIEGTA